MFTHSSMKNNPSLYIINSEVPINYIRKEEMEPLNLFCNAVLVILYDTERTDDSRNPQFLFQTFKIDLNTKFFDLQRGVVNFWELSEREEDFELRTIDEAGNCHKLTSGEEYLDTFLKGKSSMKKAKFIFCPKNLSNFKLILLI